jgi:Cu+-exporting ATPase
VDPLRAGHVAALEGRGFHYFCDAACKQEYLRGNGQPSQEDVPTASPPEVAYALTPSAPPSIPSRGSPAFSSNGPAGFPSSRSHGIPSNGASSAPVSGSAAPSSGLRPSLPSVEMAPVRPTLPSVGMEAVIDPGPRTVPSVEIHDVPRAAGQGIESTSAAGARAATSSSQAQSVAPKRGLDRSTSILDALGMVAGVFALAIGLLGSVADLARVPLIVVAWAALAIRMQRAGRDPSDPHPLVVLAPAGGAVAAACWAQAAGDPHAVAIAVFAGLACAVAIAVEATVTLARARILTARDAVERALDVRVRAIQGEDTIDMPASDVRPGEQIVVEAGEVVGVDAIVTAGEARVVPWMGATVEVTKREGDPLVAGARVVSSRLRMITTWSGRERAWVRLLSVPAVRIDVAAPTARALRHTVERGVPVAAVAVGVATFATSATPAQVLAAACAGAMAFAAKSLVSLAALHFARAHLEALAGGITYKDPRAFERAGSANVAVLSARGTVLMGEPEIVAIEPIGNGRASKPARGETAGETAGETGVEDEVGRVLALAAGAETASTHPFAAAILRAARVRSAKPDHVRNATVHAGLGITALASSGERLVVGGRAIMLAEKIGVAVADGRVTELEAEGRSVLLVALGDRVIGLIALQDGLCAGARAAVQRLLDTRIEPVLMSGEARDTCETIGRALDIEHVRPAVLPADRGPEVRALGEGGSVVAVIGHAVSDDGALGAADVSIAMGAAGSTPGEWAVALASDDVRDAAIALAIPHAARARVRVAIVLGATPGLVALLAVFFGVAPLAVAPLAGLLGAIAVAVHARES